MKNYCYFVLFFMSIFFDITDAQQGDIEVVDNTSLFEVQKYQAEFDALWFDKEYFKNDKNFEKLRFPAQKAHSTALAVG